MKTEKKVAIAACIALLIILLVNTPFTYSKTKLDNTTYMVFSKDIAFKLPAYNTIIYFSEDYRFTKFEWDQWNATMIYFYNLQMDGDEVPKFGVSVRNANLTIQDLFAEDLSLNVTLEAPINNISTVKFYFPWSDSFAFIRFDNGTFMELNVSNNIVEITINHTTATRTFRIYHGKIIQKIRAWTNPSVNITSISFTDQRLHVVLEGPTGVTGTTVIYCPYDPVAIYEDGELKTTNYVWNPSTKLLTVNVTFSSPVKLDIYFAVPKVESHKVYGMILGYVFPGDVTVNLDISLYTYTGEAVSTTTRITVDVYDSSGNLVYSTAKRETITQQPKTVTVNIPSLETGTYTVKIKLENPDTGETLNTYSFLLKVTYPWWLWTAIIAIIIAATGIAILISKRETMFTYTVNINIEPKTRGTIKEKIISIILTLIIILLFVAMIIVGILVLTTP